MDSSDGESLVETVDGIWTLWGDIFDIVFQPSTNPEFRIWIGDQLQNVEILTTRSNRHYNNIKFDEIQTKFIEKIRNIDGIYQRSMIKPTTEMIHEYNVDMVAISERLEALYENNTNQQILQQINIKIDKIWRLIEHDTKYGFVNRYDDIWETNWNEAQRQNIVMFESKANTKFNKEQTLVLNAFITLLKRMTTLHNERWGGIKWPSNILQRLDELINTLAPSQRIRLTTQTGGLKSHEKADDQIESAIHRLISICEKLADQKKLAR